MSSPDPMAARTRRAAALGARTFDVLVIGGGITGCGIARDAALRGLDVALVEKDDFASGTSSRSSRLIHGGVRYLEHGHLHLVFESSAERRLLLRVAPHLVQPLEFTWPVFADSRIPRWKLGAGLMLYDMLSLFRNVGRHRRLSAAAVLAREPGLRRDRLLGGASYYDALTNDARLTLANALGAAGAGATIVNHAVVRELITAQGRVAGAIVVDAIGGTRIEVRARAVVNATGPWSDEVRALGGESRVAVRGSKGAHIAVPRERVGNAGALTLLAPADGRVCFVLPSGPQTIVGTTDSYTSVSPDDVSATRGDVMYLLKVANEFFPGAHLGEEDVISAWAGIRPLLPSSSSTPGSASREHMVDESESGLISITGGKLTTFRVMSAQVVEVVVRRLGRAALPSVTAALSLPGGDLGSLDKETATATDSIGDERLARHLVASYGTRWRDVWATMRDAPDGREAISAGSPYTVGELRYAVTHEMAMTLADLLLRRTRLGFETHDHGRQAAPRAADAVATLLGWDAARIDAELAAYRIECERLFRIVS